MNTEDDKFQRIEAEALRRAQDDDDDDTQVYKKHWVGLTDEEIIDVIFSLVMADLPDEATDLGIMQFRISIYDIARAIEAKLKERNT